MEPMKPMKPMAPMKPMEPMKPMQLQKAWWPEDLGQPGKTTVYDSGDHRISGVQQAQGGGKHLAFTSQHGTVDLDSLKQI